MLCLTTDPSAVVPCDLPSQSCSRRSTQRPPPWQRPRSSAYERRNFPQSAAIPRASSTLHRWRTPRRFRRTLPSTPAKARPTASRTAPTPPRQSVWCPASNLCPSASPAKWFAPPAGPSERLRLQPSYPLQVPLQSPLRRRRQPDSAPSPHPPQSPPFWPPHGPRYQALDRSEPNPYPKCSRFPRPGEIFVQATQDKNPYKRNSPSRIQPVSSNGEGTKHEKYSLAGRRFLRSGSRLSRLGTETHSTGRTSRASPRRGLGRSPYRRRNKLIRFSKFHCSLHSHGRILDPVPQARS